MLRFKPEVQIAFFRPQLQEAMSTACLWSLATGTDIEVNSINDSTHGATSLHPYDLALDLDTAGDRADDLASLYAFLGAHLSATWDVVLESDHVHLEWDAR